MRVVSDLATWRAVARELRRGGRRVGLVPTMGALHAGHESLVAAARERGDAVILTIFVNPRQFNDADDLARYPRTPAADEERARRAGVDVLVSPSLEQMWPAGAATPTTVNVGALGELFEGADRPGHFNGVASVVAKLLVLNGPGRLYLGEKDFQQLVLVRQMVRDLGFDVEVVGCPIVRESSGLALSSRNVRLSAAGRDVALGFSRALASVLEVAPASVQRARLRAALEEAGVQIAYADVVDPASLASATDDEVGERRALLAGYVEGVRLIDNGPLWVGR
jgi:pantoate--beta-alanine ligase